MRSNKGNIKNDDIVSPRHVFFFPILKNPRYDSMRGRGRWPECWFGEKLFPIKRERHQESEGKHKFGEKSSWELALSMAMQSGEGILDTTWETLHANGKSAAGFYVGSTIWQNTIPCWSLEKRAGRTWWGGMPSALKGSPASKKVFSVCLRESLWWRIPITRLSVLDFHAWRRKV